MRSRGRPPPRSRFRPPSPSWTTPAEAGPCRNRWPACLADRYTVERQFVCGRTSAVYLATDLRHDRPVVKVLRPELAAVLGRERFLGEIQTTPRPTHPHIVPLLDSGDVDGTLFCVMPCVEGESLRDRESVVASHFAPLPRRRPWPRLRVAVGARGLRACRSVRGGHSGQGIAPCRRDHRTGLRRMCPFERPWRDGAERPLFGTSGTYSGQLPEGSQVERGLPRNPVATA
jgi:hypothetical protein